MDKCSWLHSTGTLGKSTDVGLGSFSQGWGGKWSQFLLEMVMNECGSKEGLHSEPASRPHINVYWPRWIYTFKVWLRAYQWRNYILNNRTMVGLLTFAPDYLQKTASSFVTFRGIRIIN